ncbi:MAG: hypothetical protein HY866_17550 [Chloroflexi bacterium]|nr:hypothetical protein [Chloroflexota bacterium]
MLRLFIRFCWVLFCLMLLVGCGDDSDDTPDSTSNNTPSPTAVPVLDDLMQHYEALRASYEAISKVWEGLAAGEQAQCGDYPTVISPESVNADGAETREPVAERLRTAAVNLDEAISLWKAECLKPRATPSPDVIDQGRWAARSAGDQLKEAEKLLAELQP